MAEQRRVARAKRRPDWKKARRLYERDGKSFTEVAELLGTRRETVSRHAHRDGWKRVDITRDALASVTEKVAGEIAREIAPAIISTVKEAERQRELALRCNGALLDGLAKSFSLDGSKPDAPMLLFGEGSSPDLTLRRCFLNLGAVVGRPVEDPGADGSDADSDTESAAVRAALEEAEGVEPKRSGVRSQGKVPH